jgi:hypothetical protein
MQQSVTNPPPAGYSAGPVWARPAGTQTFTTTSLFPAGPSCQPCPECGGLECLCRPRFFAGQLLTEQDLNRLDQYIIAKNQLHNRYLVGHGVVCGLEVACSPCANTLSVSAGYAIDPCGNDIIVCSPDTVDICTLIKACTPTTQANCAPYKDTTFCKDVEQDWILAIRYQETPSRGVTPLTGASQCSCGSGGGSCSCGAASKPCGCGSMKPAGSCCGQTVTSTTLLSANLPRRGAPTACEPTTTCEAYSYAVFPAPPKTTPVDKPVYGIAGLASTIGGDMFARIACCVQGLQSAVQAAQVPTQSPANDPQSWSTFLCNLRQNLLQLAVTQGTTDCQLVAKLQAIVCPGPNDPNFAADAAAALEAEILILLEFLLGCFCSAALPPCLPPGDPRVPLASIRVRASDCTIISVCDWTPLRKHVVTTKTLGYWLGWLPYVPIIRAFMQEVCCNLFNLRGQLSDVARDRTAAAPTAQAATVGGAAETDRGQGLNQPISFSTRTYYASNPISEAVAANLAAGPQSLSVLDLMNALSTPIDPGTPGQTAVAKTLVATPHAKVLAEVARPLVNSFSGLFSALTGGLAPPADGTFAAMRTELDQLHATVKAQQAELDALKPKQA